MDNITPLNEDEARQILADAPAEPASHGTVPRSSSGLRTAVPKSTSGARTTKPVSAAKSGHAPAVNDHSVPLQKPSQMPLMIGTVSAGVLLIVLVLFFSGKKEPERVATANSEPRRPEPTRSAPTAEKTPDPGPASAPSNKAYGGLLTEPDRKEPTPKELYDQAVREGRIKPNEPIPAAPPPAIPATPATATNPAAAQKPVDTKSANLLSIATPAADDPAWKPLFNGKDLTGWNPFKGKWSFDSGMAHCTFAGDGGARLDGTTSFTDFELTAQLWADQRTYTDFRIHDTINIEFHLRDAAWHALRVVSIGNVVQATLDGQPLTASGSGGPGGVFHIYIDKGSTAKIKDLRLRTLTAADLPKP
jgi:hypothetical protein